MSRTGAILQRAPVWTAPLLVLVAMTVMIELMRPGVLSIGQLTIKTSETMTLILVATGMTIVVLRGGIDLSVGGTLSLATAIAATRTDGDFVALLPWLVFILALGAGIGVINGALISLLGLQPFLVTLATWSVVEGIALIILPTELASVPAAWFEAGYADVLGFPVPVVLLVVLLVWWAWFHRTRSASRIFAAGSSERAAFLNRVSLGRTNLLAYGASGLFAASAGFFYATQTGAGSPVVGTDYVLPAIAAVVIGGTSLAGGRGSLIGTIIGALILNFIGDIIFLLHVSSYWQPVAAGLILVGVVLISSITQTAAERSEAAA